jgi:hypothetical protein
MPSEMKVFFLYMWLNVIKKIAYRVEYTSRFLLVASFDKSKVKQKFETTKFFLKYFFL